MNIVSRLASLNGALRLETYGSRLPEIVSTETLTMGAEAIDQRLQGGLTRAGLHEFCAAEPDDAAATSGFAPLLSLRCAASKLLIWVRECRCEDGDGRLRAPGLEELGATLHNLVIVTAPDAFAVLRLFRHC